MKKSIVFLGFIGLSLTTNIVFATPPLASPDFNWFKAQIEFDTTGLPQGINIIKNDSETSIYLPSKWFIRNQSVTPLYLLKKKTDSYDDRVKINVFSESKIPNDFVPIYKLISNEVYYPRNTYIKQGVNHDLEGKYYVAEKLADDCGKSYCISCPRDSCDPSVVVIDHIPYDLGVKPTKNIYQENRPSNSVIPEHENFKLLAYYGTNPIEIKGRFTYSLNDNYGNNYGLSRGLRDNSFETNYRPNILIGVGIILFLIIAYFLIKKFRSVV